VTKLLAEPSSFL